MTVVDRLKEASMVRSMFGSVTAPDAPRKREDVSVEELRQARLAVARRNSRWTEIEEVDLVPRHRHWLVSATTDELFERHRGIVFQSGSCSVIADLVELSYYIDRDGEIVFLERVSSRATWTEHLEKQAERERRRNAPRQRPSWMDAKR